MSAVMNTGDSGLAGDDTMTIRVSELRLAQAISAINGAVKNGQMREALQRLRDLIDLLEAGRQE